MKSCNANPTDGGMTVLAGRVAAASNNREISFATLALVSLRWGRASDCGLPVWRTIAFDSPPCWLSGSGLWCRTVGDGDCGDQRRTIVYSQRTFCGDASIASPHCEPHLLGPHVGCGGWAARPFSARSQTTSPRPPVAPAPDSSRTPLAASCPPPAPPSPRPAFAPRDN